MCRENEVSFVGRFKKLSRDEEDAEKRRRERPDQRMSVSHNGSTAEVFGASESKESVL